MKRKLLLLFVPLLLLGYFFGKKFYLAPLHAEGEKAPEIMATLANGEDFKLSELRGKYVLLDFWGSWCGPCIQEFPAIKDLHGKFAGAKFKDADGLAIVSVAIEKQEGRWRNALERYQFPWKYQVYDGATDLRFFDAPIAKGFGVKQLPTKFLISPSGNIISVNPSPTEVAAFLQMQLQ